MRRATKPFILAVLLSFVAVASCSKKSGSPVAPPPPEDPNCSLSASALSFGSVPVGSSVDRAITLTNSGTGTIAGTASLACPEFTLVGATAYSLGAGERATLTVRFSPTTVGAKACTLATGSALCAKVPCAGTGQSTTPQCNVLTTLIDFGTVDYGSGPERNLIVENTGGGTLVGSVSGLPMDFSFIGPSTFSLTGGQQAILRLKFSPTTGGAQRCTLRVDPPGCAPIIAQGWGNLPTYGLCNVRVTSGDTLDFGEVSVGQSLTKNVTVMNGSGTYPSVGGADDFCPDFVGSFDTSLPPGGSGSRPVTFTPSRTGLQFCAVSF